MGNPSELFILLVIAAVFVPSASATDYIVGDDKGWTDLGFNYTVWAQGKTFHLGDNLIFKYKIGAHNVFKVNGTEFQQCKVLGNQTGMTTGNDVIPLTKVGRKWYFCGVGDHCAKGQKFAITVLDQLAPGPSPLPIAIPPPPPATTLPAPPTPASAAKKAAVSGHFGLIFMVFGVLGMIVA